MKRPPVHVTNHAVLRYLEREKGMDIEAIRTEIARKVDVARDHEGASGVIVGGLVFKLQGLTVTTVIPHSEPDRRTGRVKR